jgi:hypothetical protein
MCPEEKPLPPAPPEEAEVQQSGSRSKVKDDKVKRIVKQHPQRDEPRVDSVEERDLPPA